MRRSSLAALVRLALTAALLTLPRIATAQNAGGLWTDDQGRLYEFSTAGGTLTLNVGGQKLTGTPGSRIDVSTLLTDPFMAGNDPEWVRVEQRKRRVRFTGTVTGDTIADGTMILVQADFDPKKPEAGVTLSDKPESRPLKRLGVKLKWVNTVFDIEGREYVVKRVAADSTETPLDKKAQPVPYRPDSYTKVDVTLSAAGGALPAGVAAKLGTITWMFDVRDRLSNTRLKPFRASATFDAKGVAHVEIKSHKELLDGTNSKVNANALEAEVKGTAKGTRTSLDARSDKYLCLVTQKPILFIPGVFGSHLWIGGVSGEQQAWFSGSNLLLNSGADGRPLRAATKIDLFRAFVLTVYDVEHQAAVDHPKALLHLYDDKGTLLPSFIVKVWPYDWRLRVEENAARLLSGGGAIMSSDTPYPEPPSLSSLRNQLKRDNPFLEEKFALVGHSTGGLIIRSLLTRPATASTAAQYVDKAFFVTVPFWGAPKAYYTYTSGDTMISALGVYDLVDRRVIRGMSPNAPIIYYLAPSARYPYSVVDKGGVRVRRADVRSGILDDLIANAREQGAYPHTLPENAARGTRVDATITGVVFLPGPQSPDLASTGSELQYLKFLKPFGSEVLSPGGVDLLSGAISQAAKLIERLNNDAIVRSGYSVWVKADVVECVTTGCEEQKTTSEVVRVDATGAWRHQLVPDNWKKEVIEKLGASPSQDDPVLRYIRARAIQNFGVKNAEQWNLQLEADAANFHASLQGPPSIGWDNTYAFWSNLPAAGAAPSDTATPGFVRLQEDAEGDRSKMTYQTVAGDGTVPLVSQCAPQDFGGTLIHIPGNPKHVDAPNLPAVWEKIVSALNGDTITSEACPDMPPASTLTSANPSALPRPPPSATAPLPTTGTDCDDNDQVAQITASYDRQQLELTDNDQRYAVDNREQLLALRTQPLVQPPNVSDQLWSEYLSYYNDRCDAIDQSVSKMLPPGFNIGSIRPPLTFDGYTAFRGKFLRGQEFERKTAAQLAADPSLLVMRNVGFGPDSAQYHGGESDVVFVDQLVMKQADFDAWRQASQQDPDAPLSITSYSNKSRRFNNADDYPTPAARMRQVEADVNEALNKYSGRRNIRRRSWCGVKNSTSSDDDLPLFNQNVQINDVVLVYDPTGTAGLDQSELDAIQARAQALGQQRHINLRVQFGVPGS